MDNLIITVLCLVIFYLVAVIGFCAGFLYKEFNKEMSLKDFFKELIDE